MPQLEDTRKLVAKTAPSGSDLVVILDVSEVGNSAIKKATLADLLTSVVAGLPGPYADDAEAAAAGVPVGGLYRNETSGYGLTVYRIS